MAQANEAYPKWRLGAVLVKGGSVQSVGMSRRRSDPEYLDFSAPGVRERVSIHAEDDCLRRCGNPHRSVLYLARIGRNGRTALAKPCDRCQSLLALSGVKRVFYTVNSDTYSVWTP